MTNISDGFFVLIFGAFALGAVVGLAALVHALYRTRTRPLGPIARAAVCLLVPLFAAVAADPPLMPGARIPVGLLTTGLAVTLLLDARRPNPDASSATWRRIAVALSLVLALAAALYRPVETWSRERAYAAQEREYAARLASPEYRRRIERQVAECERADADGTRCYEFGFDYRRAGDIETAVRFLILACDRGHDTACRYARDP